MRQVVVKSELPHTVLAWLLGANSVLRILSKDSLTREQEELGI